MPAFSRDMILSVKLEQRHLQQRATAQVEWAARLFTDQSLRFGFTRRFIHIRQIDDRQGERRGGLRDLDRLSVHNLENGSKHLMTANDLVNAPFQYRGIDLACETQRDRHVVKRTAGLQLIQEP